MDCAGNPDSNAAQGSMCRFSGCSCGKMLTMKSIRTALRVFKALQKRISGSRRPAESCEDLRPQLFWRQHLPAERRGGGCAGCIILALQTSRYSVCQHMHVDMVFGSGGRCTSWAQTYQKHPHSLCMSWSTSIGSVSAKAGSHTHHILYLCKANLTIGFLTQDTE